MNVAGCANRGLLPESSCLDFIHARTHFHISPNVAALPCISRPVRKILPAAYTAATDVSAASATASATCQTGGPGGIMMRSSIRNGALVGNSDKPTAILLSGA